MTSILFICHGNICRSPMAEFVFKDMVEKLGRSSEFNVASAATSYEEIGNPVHYGTRKILDRLNICYAGKRAEKLLKSDYDKYDYFVGMDGANISNMRRLFDGDKNNKVYLLLDFAGQNRDVADPWWTGDFQQTYADVKTGVEAFLQFLLNQQNK